MATLVKFYKEGNHVLAVFPQHKDFNGYRRDNVTCYSRVGQHSSANPDYYKKLKEATKEEFSGLAEELVSIGYDLKILNKQ